MQINRYILVRLEFVSDISKDISQVCFGVLAIESFTRDIVNWNLVLSGVLLAGIWWTIGIISFRIK